jgi:WD40 repeat protein
MVFSPDGSRIVFTFGTTIRIWNADGSGEPRVLSGHQDMVSTVTFSSDGSRIVSTSISDGTVRVWRSDGSGEPLVIPAQAYGARFTPDGQRIVAISEGQVRVWEDLTLPSLHDPRLWTITNYCMPIAVRQQLLGVSEESARRDLQRCLERVEQARRTEVMRTQF